jgi:hypothetical protein
MKKTVRIKQWAGGISPDDSRGPVGSAAYISQLDFRRSPSVIQSQPQTAETSSGVVTDLLIDMVVVPNGDIYAIGDLGNFYKRAADTGLWVHIDALGEASGGSLVYRSDQDAILIPLQTKVAQYGPVAGTPTPAIISVNKYAQSVSTDFHATSSGGTLTYTVPTAITENFTDQSSFLPDIEPLYSIKVKIVVKGSGNWTLTLHDGANNVLGTSTIPNGSLNSNALNEFVFTTPIRMLVKPNARRYHFHLTSTVADGTVATQYAGDLSICDYEIWASRLVPTKNGWHPAVQFLQYTLYGNERYVAIHEPLEDTATNAEFQRHRLTFPSGYEVCGMALYQGYVAIPVERQNTSSTELQNGMIFLWNGLDTTYNDAIPIPEGSPYSLFAYENELYWQAEGSWYKLVGRNPQRILRFPGATEEMAGAYNYLATNPNMLAVRKGTLLAGFPTTTTNTDIEYGVYSLGSLDRTYDESFGLDFTLSTGSRFNTGNKNLKIGCVKNFGDDLYISWRDDSNTTSSTKYGVDTITPLSTAATAGRYEALWYDDGQPERYQDNLRMFIKFNALPAGCTVTPIWRVERDGAWQNESGSQGQGVVGDTAVVLPIEQKSTECQIGFIVAGTGSAVKIRTIALQYDDLHYGRYTPEEDIGVLG